MGLNRTSVGLKPTSILSSKASDNPRPQSNQRGIETRAGNRNAGTDSTRLNRTSVGLKQRIEGKTPSPPRRLNRTSVGLKPYVSWPVWGLSHCWPQSNQRGIETQASLRASNPRLAPQSNQRGIETTLQAQCLAGHRACLNRTSVGLKLGGLRCCLIWIRMPQSNQRGIETP